MGTEILRPQDCLTDRIRLNPAMCSRRRNYGYANPNYCNHKPNRKPTVRYDKPDQRRQQRAQSEPSMSRKSISDDSKNVKRSSCDDLRTVRSYENNHNNYLVMENVTILRRGESLDSKMKSGNGMASSKKEGERLVVTGTVRFGPAPKQFQMAGFNSPVPGKSDVYAGSAFAVSPAPSSLPLPSFSKKKTDHNR
ncbi:Proline-rich nuclear receptor coactivator [Melia azedarach]|uniref:Proline-rich nuclear receptor coactivator n=1 Tax=Melia azedarach TaxID=155640 RepID=A0ACC1YGN3_MELAZ|nr:Proline-rich nuclear receptor coactivator [Melia azedarach]